MTPRDAIPLEIDDESLGDYVEGLDKTILNMEEEHSDHEEIDNLLPDNPTQRSLRLKFV
jgi:hypothetical protein